MAMSRVAVCFALLISGVASGWAGESARVQHLTNVDSQGVAIKGYDAVAYFTEGKAIQGAKDITYQWNGALWRFATQAHRELFVSQPEKYAPQFGGYCAYGAATGKIFDVDPEAWEIKGGKLYLVHNQNIKQQWIQDYSVFVEEANRKWPGILNANE